MDERMDRRMDELNHWESFLVAAKSKSFFP